MPQDVRVIAFTIHYQNPLPDTPRDIAAFRDALDNGDLLDQIMARNPDLVALSSDPDGHVHFMGTLRLEGPVTSALDDKSGPEHALGAILERIFWVPPVEPRISGVFWFEWDDVDAAGGIGSGGGSKGGT